MVSRVLDGVASTPGRIVDRRRSVGLTIALAVLTSLGAVACEPEPNATVYVLGDSNLPVWEVVYTTRIRDRPYLVVPDPFPGFGVVNDPIHGLGSDFLERRLAGAISRISPDLVVIELGVNDHELSWLDGYDAAIDRLMARIPGSIKVIWTNVVPVPGRFDAAMQVNDELRAAEGRWPNLWVVELDRIISELLGGQCPVLSQGTVSWQPIQACFESYDAGSPHLAPSGSMLWAAAVRIVMDEYLTRGQRADEIELFRQLLQTVTVTTTTLAADPATSTPASTEDTSTTNP
ncbi:MAG: SGNH/GDSL hydrolase family protein [Acidimicrobiales bacterium]|nr:SGNH/GDSL hydrolase family protein [Acidimicrobiales bacterium]